MPRNWHAALRTVMSVEARNVPYVPQCCGQYNIIDNWVNSDQAKSAHKCEY